MSTDPKTQSYRIRESLPGAQPGIDWTIRMPEAKPVTMRALRSTGRSTAGRVVQLLCTSNAGFAGITGFGLDGDEPVHMGCLGDWEII